MKNAWAFRLFAPALLAGALVIGCGGSDSPNPTAPSKPVTPPPPPATPLVESDLVLIVLNDATERIIPSLIEGSERTLLVNAFGNLVAAVTSRVVKSVQETTRASREALAAFAARDSDEIASAELDAIRIYLDYVDEKVAATQAGN